MKKTSPHMSLRLTFCLFGLILCSVATAAQQNTYYEIVAKHSGKCLHVERRLDWQTAR